MSWYMQSFPPPAYVVRPEILVELAYHQPAPPMPNELQGALGEKEFSDRMNILLRTLGRYSWSNMMRIYTTVVIVFSFIVPAIIILVINKVVAAQAFNEEGELVDLDKLKEARGIQAGIFLGSIFFLWLPWFVLRRRGDKAMENALTNFNMSDQAKGTMQNLNWRVQKHSLYTRRAMVAIKLPSAYFNNSASVFHPQAYHGHITGYAPPSYPAAQSQPVQFAPPPDSPPKEEASAVYPPPPREPPSENPFADGPARAPAAGTYAPPPGPPPPM